MATIKYWNGSAWELAIVGKQGPVGPTGPTGPAGSASLQRFRYVATGGQTSVSGTDANGNTLAYTPGLEEVFINGAAQVRGQDYTATDGTSITGIGALLASDVVEVYAWGVFNVANTISNTLVDAKGDILAGTGADSVGRLAVGANNTVLTADSSTATGLKWTALSSALNIAQIATGTLSGSGISLTGLSNYDVLELRVTGANVSANDQNLRVYANNDITSGNWEYAIGFVSSRSTYNAADYDGAQATSANNIQLTNNLGLMASNTANRFFIRLTNCKSAGMTFVDYWSVYRFSAGGTQTNCWAVGTAIWKTEAAISSLQFNSQFNTFSGGTYTLWGA